MRAGLSIRADGGGPDRRPLQGSPEEIVGDLRRFAELGVGTVLLETRFRDLDDLLGIYRTVAQEIRPRL